MFLSQFSSLPKLFGFTLDTNFMRSFHRNIFKWLRVYPAGEFAAKGELNSMYRCQTTSYMSVTQETCRVLV